MTFGRQRRGEPFRALPSGWARVLLGGILPAVNKTRTVDTHPAVEALLIDGYRKMTPSQKLERVRALTRAVQELALLDIRRRYPDADQREVALRLASRWLDAGTMAAAFGWNQQDRGY